MASNLAYDFEALEQHYAASDVSKVRQPAQLHVVENRNAHSKESFMRGAVIFIVIAMLVSAAAGAPGIWKNFCRSGRGVTGS